jgi:hypothetical protein
MPLSATQSSGRRDRFHNLGEGCDEMTEVPREILTKVVEGCEVCRDWTGVMQCAFCELRRTPLVGTSVNKSRGTSYVLWGLRGCKSVAQRRPVERYLHSFHNRKSRWHAWIYC